MPRSQALGSAFLAVASRYSLNNQNERRTLLPDRVLRAFGHSYAPIEVAPESAESAAFIDAKSESGTSF